MDMGQMIAKGLRGYGWLFEKLFRFGGEEEFRRKQKYIAKLFANRNFSHANCRCVPIKREDGSELSVQIYTPKQRAKPVPGFLWIHGGGYAIGTPALEFTFVNAFMDASPCVMVLPDYTLSIEKPYPVALMDCYLALNWMRRHAKELGIRSDQLFVGGDSAGGGLAAAVTLYARDRGEVRIAFQMPLYPMLDDRMQTSSAQNNYAPVWNSAANEQGWRLYLDGRFGTDDVPKYAALAREMDFAGLPPAYSFVGTIEPFYDETREYFRCLRNAGVTAQLDEYAGCFHAFDQLCLGSRCAKEARHRMCTAYRYAVEYYFAPQ